MFTGPFCIIYVYAVVIAAKTVGEKNLKGCRNIKAMVDRFSFESVQRIIECGKLTMIK